MISHPILLSASYCRIFSTWVPTDEIGCRIIQLVIKLDAREYISYIIVRCGVVEIKDRVIFTGRWL
jgi:hypothetical protein